MGGGYKIDKQDAIYFMTSTVVGWVDLFIRDTYKKILADSLNFCIKYKGLNVHAYVFMSSHIHLVASSNNNNLSQIMCDFKKFTSNQLIREILTLKESRREWMAPIFREAGLLNPRNTHFQIWQNGNHPKETFAPEFTAQKIRYIHQNPVKEGIVLKAEDYLYSSARDYAGLKSPVNTDILLIDQFGATTREKAENLMRELLLLNYSVEISDVSDSQFSFLINGYTSTNISDENKLSWFNQMNRLAKKYSCFFDGWESRMIM